MALGKRNANPGSGVASQSSAASPEKLDAFLDAVGTRLNQLQATVADLVERSAHEGGRPAGGVSMPPLTGDSDIDSASRTLVLAQRTADTLLAEAREEAAKLIATTQAASDAMLAEAKAAADAELGTQRAQLTAEQARWDQLKAELSEGFGELDEQIDSYVTNLSTTHAAVKEVLRGFDIPAEVVDEPEPEPEIDLTDEAVDVTEAATDEDGEPVLDEAGEPVAVDEAGEPVAAPEGEAPSMFGPRTTPLFSGQSTGWNNEGGEAAAPPVTEAPPAPSRRPGFFGQ